MALWPVSWCARADLVCLESVKTSLASKTPPLEGVMVGIFILQRQSLIFFPGHLPSAAAQSEALL